MRTETDELTKARAAMRLYLDGYERYFTTSGDDEPQKMMAEARRQMRSPKFSQEASGLQPQRRNERAGAPAPTCASDM